MKRIMLAILLMAACRLAAAQSVQLYGLIDTGVEYLTNVGASGTSLIRATQLTGGQMPSRWGLRGSEDLGHGMRAIFTLENGFSVTNGGLGQSGRMFGRAAFVGLSGRWGTVTFGRQQEMVWRALRQADVIGSAAFSLVDFDPFLASAREDNSLAYQGKFGNLTIGATYSLGRDVLAPGNCAGQMPGDGGACRAWSTMAQYQTLTWGVAVGYDQQNGGGASSVVLIPGQPSIPLSQPNDRDRRFIADGFVKLAALKIGMGWLHRRITTDVASIRTDLYFIGTHYAFAPRWSIDAQYAALRSSMPSGGGDLVTVRANYGFSKQTAVYAMLSRMFNGRQAAYSVSSTSPVPAAPQAGQAQSGVLIGMRHRF